MTTSDNDNNIQELLWTFPENEPLKDVAGELFEWYIWDQILLRSRLPRREDGMVFVESKGDIRLRTENAQVVSHLPTIEEATLIFDKNSDAYKLKIKQLRFVKATAGTLRETQSLFGMLAHRIKKLEQSVDPATLASAPGYVSFAAAKTDTLNTIFALDSAGFYDNLLH